MTPTQWAQLLSPLIAAAGILVAAFRVIAAQRHTRTDSLLRIIDRMEEHRNSRHVVYSLASDPKSWNDSQAQAADDVCRSFDILGYLHREHVVPDSLLREFYAVAVVRCWKRCQKYVYQMRSERNQPGHYRAFEELAKHCRKLRPDASEE